MYNYSLIVTLRTLSSILGGSSASRRDGAAGAVRRRSARRWNRPKPELRPPTVSVDTDPRRTSSPCRASSAGFRYDCVKPVTTKSDVGLRRFATAFNTGSAMAGDPTWPHRTEPDAITTSGGSIISQVDVSPV